MKQPIKQIIVACLVLALALAPGVVLAEGGSDDSTESPSPSPSSSESPEPTDTENHDFADAKNRLMHRLEALREQHDSELGDNKGENLHERLSGNFKKACENHVATINRLMTNMDKRRTNAFDRITKIAEAIEAFAVKKNLTVPNYDQLVAAIAAAKQAAQTATEGQTAIPQLNCDGDHPRADVVDFKKKRMDSIDAMKAYRDAVKALGKAVKTALGDIEAQGPNTGTVSKNNDGSDVDRPGATGGTQ